MIPVPRIRSLRGLAHHVPGFRTRLAALLSVVCLGLFFVPPPFKLAVADAEYLLTFAAMLVTALLISRLTARLRLQLEASRRRGASQPSSPGPSTFSCRGSSANSRCGQATPRGAQTQPARLWPSTAERKQSRAGCTTTVKPRG